MLLHCLLATVFTFVTALRTDVTVTTAYAALEATKEPTTTRHDDIHTTLDGFFSILTSSQDGQWDNTAAIYEFGDTLSYNILRKLHSFHHPVIQYQLASGFSKQDVELIAEECYEKQNLVNFMIFHKEYLRILELFSGMYSEKGKQFLMSNRLKIIILHHEWEENDTFWKSVEFDNVVFVCFDKVNEKLKRLQTLMYQTGYIRCFQNIPFLSIFGTPTRFNLFPNTQFGLNGRRLHCLVKDWTYEVIREVDPVTKELSYTGFGIVVAELLAKSLNFTLVPVPNASLPNPMTWTQVSESVAKYQVDLSLPLWSGPSIHIFNHSVTYPVYIDAIVAAYVMTDRIVHSPIRLPEILENNVLACVLGLLVFMVLFISFTTWALNSARAVGVRNRSSLYQMVAANSRAFSHTWSTIWSSGTDDFSAMRGSSDVLNTSEFKPNMASVKSEENNQNESRPKDVWGHSQPEEKLDSSKLDLVLDLLPKLHGRNVQQGDTKILSKEQNPKDNSTEKTTKARFEQLPSSRLKLLVFIYDLIFVLFGTFLQQALTISVNSISVRLILWSWLITALMLVSVYKGSITAEKVSESPNLPFRTVDEMLHKGEYDWCVSKDQITFLQSLKEAKEDSTLGRLYKNLVTCSSEEDMIEKVRKGNFVGISERPSFYKLKEYGLNPTFLDDPLNYRSGAIPMPRDSPLVPIFSEKIQAFHDSGLLETCRRKWTGSTIEMSSSGHGRDGQLMTNTPTALKDVQSVLLICCFGIAVSLGILLGEWLVYIALRCHNGLYCFT